MCGIAGWIASGADAFHAAPPPTVLDEMLESMAHRGPDGCGTWSTRTRSGAEVRLGHQRLAIIDPAGSAQPLHDPVSGITLAFNGEIYNFRELRSELRKHGHHFCRDSDTEVLLRAYQHWRSEVVHHLRGMFAIAIWDAASDVLFLARDRFGEKPLFIHERDGDIYFASEIKALLRVPGVHPSVNLDAVWAYLAYRYVPAPATLFQGIRKLMPGTRAEWKHGRLVEERYWTAPDRDRHPPRRRRTDPAGEFLERLDEAVQLQMVSDVPFGAFLSGGVDSSTIVALMRRHSLMVRTFSAGFRDEAYSELPYAADVARRLGTQHHEVVVSSEDFIEQLGPLVASRDAPVSEPSDVPIYMLACEASRHVKMVLTGEGSDELLGGYPKHLAEGLASGFQRLPSTLRHRLIVPLVSALPYGFRRLKTAVKCLNISDPHERFARWFGALSGEELNRLCVLPQPQVPGGNGGAFDFNPQQSPLRRILYFDQTSWLPDNLLERADRMTMAASIEARVPFLDHKLAEFVSTLPDRSRVSGLRGKRILRDAAARLLPPHILTRPKVGFRVPVNDWFRGPMRDYLLDHLRGSSSFIRPYFDARALDGIVDAHDRGRENHEKLLWSLLNLELWHRQYLDEQDTRQLTPRATVAA